MKRTATELAYVTAAVQNASPAGLVVILYDQLIKDLQGAIVAIQKNNVEERAAEIKHGFMVLQQLQESLNMDAGGDTAQHLSRFYTTVRAAMLKAHMDVSAEILQCQIQLLFEVRQAWEQVDARQGRDKGDAPPVPRAATALQPSDEDERTPADWNA